MGNLFRRLWKNTGRTLRAFLSWARHGRCRFRCETTSERCMLPPHEGSHQVWRWVR
jgi:hypothetical protein